MRADRLLSILLLLQMHGQITASGLARRLEVSERTIHRDMEALGTAGVPVVSERGPAGGWRLMEGYETRLTGLNQAEVQALFLPHSSRVLGDLGLDRAAEEALIRLMAALPASVRRDAEFARERILVDGAPWHAAEGEDLSLLPRVQEAIWRERRLHLAYERGDGTVVERVADPLGLVAKGRTWYLVAVVDGEPRTYRIARIREARVGDEPSVRPPGFDLAAFWAQSAAAFVQNLPRYVATLRVHPDLLPLLRLRLRFARVETIGRADTSGWTPVQIWFQSEAEACEQVLGMGPLAVVAEPGELGRKVAALAEQVVALY